MQGHPASFPISAVIRSQCSWVPPANSILIPTAIPYFISSMQTALSHAGTSSNAEPSLLGTLVFGMARRMITLLNF